MFLALLITVIFSLQSAPGATFEVDLWPGEGRPVFEAVVQQLRLHELPSESSRVVETVRVRPKQRLAFDDTRYRTIKPGRFLVLASTDIIGRRLGDLSRLSSSDYYSGKFGPASAAVRAGDSIEYLQYRAEGTCFIRIAGSVIDADPCPTFKEAQFRLESKPAMEWWIHIIVNGKALGWLLVTDATAKVVDREF
jgi:hypothetical protein